jgi:hypothetical protein
MKQILKDAFKSDELKQQLEDVIAVDDKIDVSEIPNQTIIEEAHYVLGKFTGESGGFEQEQDYQGENGPELKKWAVKNVRALRAFIKKYDAKHVSKPAYVRSAA